MYDGDDIENRIQIREQLVVHKKVMNRCGLSLQAAES